MKKLIFLPLLAFYCMAFSQPSTEVYLFDLGYKNGVMALSVPINISSNDGYDNQPSFWPDGKSILYARYTEGQTEIARYFIKSEKTKIITNTIQGSEYSPTVMPNGKQISSIRLDTTGLQLLYAYDLKGKVKVLDSDLVIGYHAWVSENELVGFVLGEPATLQLINIGNGEAQVLDENIGRSLHKIPNRNAFSYVDKSSEEWKIVSMHPKSKEKQDLISVIFESEDYAWLSPTQIITGHNGILYTWKVGDKNWKSAFDLGVYGLKEITRIAISPDGKKMAIVSL